MNSFTDNFTKYENCTPPGVRLPKIKIEDRHYDQLNLDKKISNYDFLRNLCLSGVKKNKIKELSNKEEYYERIKMELRVFKELGFVDYILLNWDVLNYCHEHNIPTGPGRGSAAGSLVLYLLDVTKVDPV